MFTGSRNTKLKHQITSFLLIFFNYFKINYGLSDSIQKVNFEARHTWV